jgi:hypothetical protein
MQFDTKVAILVLDGMATWQKLNVTNGSRQMPTRSCRSGRRIAILRPDRRLSIEIAHWLQAPMACIGGCRCR